MRVCKRCRRQLHHKGNSVQCRRWQQDRKMERVGLRPTSDFPPQGSTEMLLADAGILLDSVIVPQDGHRHYAPAWALEVAGALVRDLPVLAGQRGKQTSPYLQAVATLRDMKDDPELALAAMRLGGTAAFIGEEA